MTNKITLKYGALIALTVLSICLLMLNAHSGALSLKEDRSARIYNISCQAFGAVSLNGYRLNYVSSFRLNKNGMGAVTISGKVYQGDAYLGVMGLQALVKYVSNEDIINLTSVKSYKQMENQIPDEVIAKLVPKVYRQPGSTQLIGLTRLGKGYRLDYNSYPTNYCY